MSDGERAAADGAPAGALEGPGALPTVAVGVLAAGAYVVLALVASIWTDKGDIASPFWPAVGVAVGLALLLGRKHGAVALAASLGAAFAYDVLIADLTIVEEVIRLVARAAESIATLGFSALIVRSERRELPFDVGTLLGVVAAFGAAVIGATIVVLGILAFGIDAPATWRTWGEWALGDGLGIFSVAPLILMLRRPFPMAWPHALDGRRLELVVTLGVLAGISLWAFSTTAPVVYGIVVVLLWLAVRFGLWVSGPTALVLVTLSTALTTRGHGPFVEMDASLLTAQAFGCVLLVASALVGRTHAMLSHESRRHRALLELMPDHATIHRGDGTALEHLGASRQDPNPDVTAALAERWPDMATENERTMVVHVGSPARHFEIRLIPLERDRVMTLRRDITAEIELFRQLERAGENWQRMSSTAYEGFIEVGPDQRVSFVSGRWADIHGMSQDDILGRPFRQLFSDEDWFQLSSYADQVLAGQLVTFEYEYSRPDGERRWVLTSADGRAGPDGFEGFVSFAADTTDLHDALQNHEVAELRLATVERRERGRIAEFLHDGPMQTMAAVSYRLGALKATSPPTSFDTGPEDSAALDDDPHDSGPRIPDPPGDDSTIEVARIEAMVLDAMSDIRAILTELSTTATSTGDIGEALRQATARFDGPNRPEVHIDDQLSETVDADTASVLYLIGREAIVNAVLHANAGAVRVTLAQAADEYHLDVIDDGQGFDPDAVSEHGHLGIRSMFQRAAQVGGYCEVERSNSGGTRVSAHVPIVRGNSS
jgi:PAS domain S-box-containing protein